MQARCLQYFEIQKLKFMKSLDKIAVCSRSFSANEILRSELLSKYENVTFNDKGVSLGGDSLVEFLKGHDKAITALEKIDDYVLSHLPQLKVIGKYGVGLDMIDLEAMKKYNKKLGWTPGVNKRSVSELVISQVINLLRFSSVSNREIIEGKWRQIKGSLLSDKTVGIIGCGHVGKDLITLLQPFHCKILVYDINYNEEFLLKYDAMGVALEKLLRNSDIVTLHLPFDVSTKNILNADMLAMMKKNSFLINMARGGLVDEVALKEMLINGKIAGAAFDVFLNEPPTDRALLNLPNFLSTGHIGGSAEEAILAMGMAAIKGLEVNDSP
jgi:D-3-phosphoglycerate dehydrogenase